jgi:hypothetical protein
MVESVVILNAVGGECFDDFQRLREDPGLSEIIGHAIGDQFAHRFSVRSKEVVHLRKNQCEHDDGGRRPE